MHVLHPLQVEHDAVFGQRLAGELEKGFVLGDLIQSGLKVGEELRVVMPEGVGLGQVQGGAVMGTAQINLGRHHLLERLVTHQRTHVLEAVENAGGRPERVIKGPAFADRFEGRLGNRFDQGPDLGEVLRQHTELGRLAVVRRCALRFLRVDGKQ